MSPILGIWASQNYSRYTLPTSYESIATTTVGSGGSSQIDFNSISSDYTHLQIRYLARGTSNDAASFNYLRMNGSSTSSDYIYLHYIQGNGSSVLAGAATSSNQVYGGRISAALAGSSRFAVGIIDILDYKNTNKYKTVRILSGYDDNGSGDLVFSSGAYIKTTAISSLSLLPGSGSFVQYSQFALYGIRGE